MRCVCVYIYICVCGICIYIYKQQVLERFGLLVSWSRFLDPVLEVSWSHTTHPYPSLWQATSGRIGEVLAEAFQWTGLDDDIILST